VHSEVPGYEAPAERTTGPGTRVIVARVGILDATSRARRLAVPASAAAGVPAALGADLAAIRSAFMLEMAEDLVARGVLVWSALFGAVSFEVFNQYGPDTFSAPEELFDHHLNVLAEVAGLVNTAE
jgi:H+/Cl- antiporter ClcA